MSKMLKQELLFLCILAGLSKASENGSYYLQPIYRHPIYNLPVYPYHPYPISTEPKESAAASVKLQESTSAGVKPKDSTSEADANTYGYAGPRVASEKRRFRPVQYCPKGKFPLANTYFFFDTDSDGVISYEEAMAASLCSSPPGATSYFLAETRPNCGWIDIGSPLHYYIDNAVLNSYGCFQSTSNDCDGALTLEDHARLVSHVKRQLAAKIPELFQVWDKDNNNCLCMDEIFPFGESLWEGAIFYQYATNDLADEAGLDVIKQNEWIPDIPLETMYGNNGDDRLTFWEFIDYFDNEYKKVKASLYFDLFCGSMDPAIAWSPDPKGIADNLPSEEAKKK